MGISCGAAKRWPRVFVPLVTSANFTGIGLPSRVAAIQWTGRANASESSQSQRIDLRKGIARMICSRMGGSASAAVCPRRCCSTTTRSPSICSASTGTPALRANPSAALLHLPSCLACFAGGPESLRRTSGAFSAMAVTISVSLRGVAWVETLARSPSLLRRTSSSALSICAAIHSTAGRWKLAGSSSVPISKTRSMSGHLEELAVPRELLLGQRPVPEGGELHLGPGGEVQPGAIVRELADAQDVSLPLGHADGAARVEQVEDVRAFQAVVVGGEGKLLLHQRAALLLVLIEETEEALRVAGVEAVLALLALVLPEDVAVGELAPVGIRAPDQVVDVVDALQVHGDALEAVGQLGGNRMALESARLLEVGELRHLHAVAPDLPAQAPGAQGRRLPVVLDEAQIVVLGGDPDRLERAQVEVLHVLGGARVRHRARERRRSAAIAQARLCVGVAALRTARTGSQACSGYVLVLDFGPGGPECEPFLLQSRRRRSCAFAFSRSSSCGRTCTSRTTPRCSSCATPRWIFQAEVPPCWRSPSTRRPRLAWSGRPPWRGSTASGSGWPCPTHALPGT